MDALVAVRRRIAQAITGRAAHVEPTLGEVTLRPHQVDATSRLLRALHAHGGALLADAPGLGKTYVALAVARAYGSALVVAPAALRAQWLRSAALAAVRIEWCSLETLSRRSVESSTSLLVVDEAHHLRNARTHRYANAAALAVGKRVLLLSATPIHNRATDREALFALFLGAAAGALPERTLASMVVRREADPALLPRRTAVRWLRPAAAPRIGALLRALPPALPAADGRAAAALVRLSLAHAWSSSVAALDATLRRAIHHAGAIDDALAAGRWPTRSELRAWVISADSSQLAFAALMAEPTGADLANARAVLTHHVAALHALRLLTARARDPDTESRAALLHRVLQRHRTATVVAFARYADTIDTLWRALRNECGVVALTSRGVRSAGGGLTRRDVLEMLAAPPRRDGIAPLRLVLSTELMGEGLDLPAVSVVVHLDQPWTPAQLDQREGRATRFGSPHASVAVYAVRPPYGAARLLGLANRLEVKRSAMDAGLAAGSARESLLSLVRPWLDARGGGAHVAAVGCAVTGWVAAVCDAAGRDRVIAMEGGAMVGDDRHLARLLGEAAHGLAATPCPMRLRAARHAISQWLRVDASTHLARAQDGESAARAAVARRFDEAVRQLPLHQRSQRGARVAAARAKVRGLRGAGAERLLAAAARCETDSAMLEAIDAISTMEGVETTDALDPIAAAAECGVRTSRHSALQRSSRLVALLLLIAA